MFFWRKHPIREVDLSTYVDGQMEPPARERLEAHIETCTPCREALAELRALRSALRELPPATAPRSFALREADVQAQAKPSPLPARQPALLGGLASVALVAFVALVGVDVLGEPSTRGGADATGAMNLPLSAEGRAGDDADGGGPQGLDGVEPNMTDGEADAPPQDGQGPETNDQGEIGGLDEMTFNAFATPECPPGRECVPASDELRSSADAAPEGMPEAVAEAEDDSRLPLRAGEAAAAAVALVAGGASVLVWRRRRV